VFQNRANGLKHKQLIFHDEYSFQIEFSFGIGRQFFGRLRVPSIGLKYTCSSLQGLSCIAYSLKIAAALHHCSDTDVLFDRARQDVEATDFGIEQTNRNPAAAFCGKLAPASRRRAPYRFMPLSLTGSQPHY